MPVIRDDNSGCCCKAAVPCGIRICFEDLNQRGLGGDSFKQLSLTAQPVKEEE